ncbi:MAG: type II toxin-antitoxin system VapC family toxin [Acidobacteria bacterium]|nr:type II toxin-antitoxin system VapC family toxin [Acidobacteriota bacterium]
MFLLDTNVVSEMRKTRPHGGLAAWISATSESLHFVSAVTLAEMQAGAEITRRQDRRKAGEIDQWIDSVVDNYRILPMGAEEFRERAVIMETASDTLMMDAMIAATARVHHLTIATRNTRDFESLGVEVYDPFTYR